MTELVIAYVLPVDVQNADELEFDEPDVVALFKKKIYKVHMYVGITFDIRRPKVSDFNTQTGPNLVQASFLHPKWSDRICPVQNMSLNSAFTKPVDIIGKIMLFV